MPNPAPTAPGRIGEAIEPSLIQSYLGSMDTWLRDRRTELDQIDSHALETGRGGEITGDMSLALALWKAIHDRYQLISATFDGGRVLGPERERISALIWGRLDGANVDMPGGLAVSMPEACRLNDALVGQLRTRLSLVPSAAESRARIRDLKAQFARIQDQVGLEPEHTRDREVRHLAGLMARLQKIEQRAEQGADVGGLLGPLEVDATTYERDLIVGNARRRDARDQVLSARELRADLEQRAAALQKLAARCVATVDPAPRYAIPDVAALGEVPVTAEEIGDHLQRLGRVSEALEWAQDKYSQALAEHDALCGELDGYVAKAAAAGMADDADLAGAEATAREVLGRSPAPMPVARQLVTTYRVWLGHLASRKERA
jgi:hypothetical protein